MPVSMIYVGRVYNNWIGHQVKTHDLSGRDQDHFLL